MTVQNTLRSGAGTGAAGQELPAAVPSEADGKLSRASEDFEAMFIQQLLREMRKSNQTLNGEDSLFHGQTGQELLDWTDQQMASVLSRQHAFGIAGAILHQLKPPAAADGNIHVNNAVAPVALSDQQPSGS